MKKQNFEINTNYEGKEIIIEFSSSTTNQFDDDSSWIDDTVLGW